MRWGLAAVVEAPSLWVVDVSATDESATDASATASATGAQATHLPLEESHSFPPPDEHLHTPSMAKQDKKIAEVDNVPGEREGPRPDFSVPPPRKKLPKELQDTLDNEEKLWEVLYEGLGEDTIDTNLRYAAYASRVRTIMLSAHRYVAYTSDIGESFRPIAHPYLVRGAYGVSWLYLVGDVTNEGYKAYLRNARALHPEAPVPAAGAGSIVGQAKDLKDTLKHTTGVNAGGRDAGAASTGGEVTAGRVPAIEDYRAVVAQRAVFQAVASMGLPAFTIHSIVRYSGRALKDAKNKTLRTWGPIGARNLTLIVDRELTPGSLASRLFLSFRTCSTRRSNTLPSGSFTGRSGRSVDPGRSRGGRSRGTRSSGRSRANLGRRRKRSCEGWVAVW